MVIRYDAGQMEVHLNGFFPTTNKRTKALLKVIDMSYSREAHLLTLENFFSRWKTSSKKPTTNKGGK